jgi:hypothetical protein
VVGAQDAFAGGGVASSSREGVGEPAGGVVGLGEVGAADSDSEPGNRSAAERLEPLAPSFGGVRLTIAASPFASTTASARDCPSVSRRACAGSLGRGRRPARGRIRLRRVPDEFRTRPDVRPPAVSVLSANGDIE